MVFNQLAERWKSEIRNDFGQVPARDVIHREERVAFVLTDFVDGDDARVLQPGDRLGLGAEALDEPGPRKLAREQHLHRHHAMEAFLSGPIHDPHAASGDDLQQFVVAEVLRER